MPPENGPVLNLFAGAHVTDYVTFQANYRWNRNDLTSVAASSTGAVSTFDEQAGRSSQHAVIGDLLLYFRERPEPFSPLSLGRSRAFFMTLWPLLGACLSRFTPTECRNYVHHCGYTAAKAS